MSLGHLAFAKSFLAWALRWHLLSIREHDFLLGSVAEKERGLIACDGKESFQTFKMAHKVAQRHARHGAARCAYHCPKCHQYHVGSRVQKPFRRSKPVFDTDAGAQGY
jgi:hypothetical protein